MSRVIVRVSSSLLAERAVAGPSSRPISDQTTTRNVAATPSQNARMSTCHGAKATTASSVTIPIATPANNRLMAGASGPSQPMAMDYQV
jgi:hypothetical protein